MNRRAILLWALTAFCAEIGDRLAPVTGLFRKLEFRRTSITAGRDAMSSSSATVGSWAVDVLPDAKLPWRHIAIWNPKTAMYEIIDLTTGDQAGTIPASLPRSTRRK